MEDSPSLYAAGVSWRALKNYRGNKELGSKLSSYQQGSLEVLQEWLKARQSDRHVDYDAEKAENRASASRTRNTLTYHDVLASLKHFELYGSFHVSKLKAPFRKFSGLSGHELGTLRRKAVYYAACERIASSYWTSAPPTRDLLTSRNQPLHGASLVPEIRMNGGSPYYLWDNQSRKVRTVEDIISTDGSFPDYVTISHSWVRWRDDFSPWLALSGVPWAIPRNTKFDVEKLPDMLSRLPWRYIWIDLLTIPQGSTLEADMRKRQDWEIKCVPQTFRKALKAVVWFDDIPSWPSLVAALEYLSLQYLSVPARTGMDQGRLSLLLKTAASAADRPLELLDHDGRRKTPATDMWEPNGWFTSPWSLQEVIMRPDILLCNHDWEFLEICKGVPVALNDIAALLRVFSQSVKPKLPQPLAVVELSQLFERTGFSLLLDLSIQTSVDTVAKIQGCSPLKGKGYPCIVASGGFANPHDEPSVDTPRYGAA